MCGWQSFLNQINCIPAKTYNMIIGVELRKSII
jgi:hypothetical protein